MAWHRVFPASVATLMAIGASLATAAPAIVLPGELAYPESLAASSDGTLFIGSAKAGGVLRVTPGSSKPTQWIAPATFGTRSIFGVLVDERSGTLWTCSNDLASDGIVSPGSGSGSALKGFDLKTGAGKVSAPFPGNHPLCNDIAVAKDGRVYVSDEYSARVLRLSTDMHSLEVFVSDPQLADIDGIAFGADGNLYANTYEGSGLFRIDVRHSTAGKVVKLITSRPIAHPDGMRPVTGNMFLMVEAAGTLDRVSFRGDKALIETIRRDMVEPSAVTTVGRTAWVAEGQIRVLYDVKHPKPPKLPFDVVPVPLPLVGNL
jgi:sugar lactone lactonase YvrE